MPKDNDLISRSELWKKFDEAHLFDDGSPRHIAQQIVEEAPTIEALPLRCRIGDEVWVVGTKCMSGLYDAECPDKDDWRSFDDYCGDCPLDREYIVFPRTVSSGIFADIHELDPENQNTLFIWGKTVFPTRAEAEAALAKMKGGEGHD